MAPCTVKLCLISSVPVTIAIVSFWDSWAKNSPCIEQKITCDHLFTSQITLFALLLYVWINSAPLITRIADCWLVFVFYFNQLLLLRVEPGIQCLPGDAVRTLQTLDVIKSNTKKVFYKHVESSESKIFQRENKDVVMYLRSYASRELWWRDLCGQPRQLYLFIYRPSTICFLSSLLPSLIKSLASS